MTAPRFHSRRGMTLVEVMVAATIGLALLGATMVSISFIHRSLDNSQKSADSFTLQAMAMDYMCRDIRSAQGVVVDNDGKRLRILLPRQYELRQVYSNPSSISDTSVSYPNGNVMVTYQSVNGAFRRFNSIGGTMEIIPAKYEIGVSFLPKTMTSAGSDVLPVTIKITAAASSQMGLTKASLATATNTQVVKPNTTVKVFNPNSY